MQPHVPDCRAAMSVRMFLGLVLAAGFVAGLGAAESGAAPQAPVQPPQLAGVAPQALGQRTANEGSQQAAHQGTAISPANQLRGSQVEVGLVEGFRPADHDPVITEQQSAKSGYRGNTPDIDCVVAHSW